MDHSFLLALWERVGPVALFFAERRSELAVDAKGERDFVSEADRAIEAAVRDALRSAPGSANVVGEEAGGALDGDGSGWAVDPLDGTSNFLCGLPLWGVSVGYLDRGRPACGLVALPELDVVLTAAPGEGARLNGRPLDGRAPTHPIRTFALGENDFETGAETDARGSALRSAGFDVVRYRCATFGLAGVALGRLDGYAERGCGLWDAAAGAAICREAGADAMLAEVAPGRYAVEARWPGR